MVERRSTMKVKYFLTGNRDYVHIIEVIDDRVASLLKRRFGVINLDPEADGSSGAKLIELKTNNRTKKR